MARPKVCALMCLRAAEGDVSIPIRGACACTWGRLADIVENIDPQVLLVGL